MPVEKINHPAHYNQLPHEVIEIVADRDFCSGNAVKYILRAPFKGAFDQDLKKAIWYLKRIQAWRIGTGIQIDEQIALQRVSREIAIENLRQALVFIAEGKIDWAIKELETLVSKEE